jgi:outer membrane protein assembly factor BamB
MAEAQQLVALTASGIVYLLRGSRLCAVRLDDECELWCGERLEGLQKDDQGRPSPVPQGAVAERYLAYAYTACDDAAHACRLHVGAVDLQAGTPLWHWRGPERPLRLPSRHYANIVAAFGNVYVTTSAGTYAFGGDGGRLLWTAPTGFEVIRLAPALAEGERT